MEPNEETEEPTIQDLMAKFEELGTRLTALETPSDPDTEDDTELDDDPEVEIKATDPADKPTDSDPKKTYEAEDGDEDEEEKKIELAAKRGAEAAIKAFSAKLGITQLGKPGPANPSKPTTKHFAEYVADEAANHDGDQAKATAHILTNKVRFPDAFKAYEAQRNVTHS